MEREQIVEKLASLLAELESAYYGGFRTTTNKEDHEAIRNAIKLIK